MMKELARRHAAAREIVSVALAGLMITVPCGLNRLRAAKTPEPVPVPAVPEYDFELSATIASSSATAAISYAFHLPDGMMEVAGPGYDSMQAAVPGEEVRHAISRLAVFHSRWKPRGSA